MTDLNIYARRARKMVAGVGRLAAANEVDREDREHDLVALARVADTVAVIEAVAQVDAVPGLWEALLAAARHRVKAEGVSPRLNEELETALGEYLREHPRLSGNGHELWALERAADQLDLDAQIAKSNTASDEPDSTRDVLDELYGS
ncbi:hypothetical protein Gbro_0551 [Gordonia bronchialis DSM 43247]|uniref:Uncharacterized protein n=1 Tax=Gordonia bronchialis (strain ATCC 25592 / DSM 43247 / BCRC 13721 / JCM 3198 / KCTC 3076 / NBRC 16047 / NCTC 10667) TaxID=526226 RepID=D0LEG3_GORB4|nr:hypothetical protein [Gordonia bronchialis]ACY19881.1 hypothetical protein Gbro_0551 [Gordonia bronchialis DSM 43247]MCC3322653.1 hypothetical protein [Gordonia bronchialis]QGS26252.1 hypothetical protein FOB84_21080 [Gordonia bronchialis]STQ62658.1 Uncharacterised protein [Gordonia bronchialis]